LESELKALIRLLLPIVFAVYFSINFANAQDVTIPNFWDKSERFNKPDLSQLPRFRFLTTTDFPPFNFIDRQKQLAGFHVDLARAICKELDILARCEIQAIPWDQLEDAVKKGQGEAIIAGLAVSGKLRESLNFSRPYLQIPARFVTRKDTGLSAPAYDALFRKKSGVVKGSSHAAYFSNFFANRSAKEFESREAALFALQAGEVEAVFSDALSLSFWLSSSGSKDCCVFFDGAYVSQEYFGSGLSVALSKERPDLVEGVNYALSKINESGTFAEIYLRYFPIGLY